MSKYTALMFVGFICGAAIGAAIGATLEANTNNMERATKLANRLLLVASAIERETNTPRDAVISCALLRAQQLKCELEKTEALQ